MSYILHIAEGFYWSLRLLYEAIQRLFKDDKAMSPIIAVLFMVALTVVLSAIVAYILLHYTDMDSIQRTANTIMNEN